MELTERPIVCEIQKESGKGRRRKVQGKVQEVKMVSIYSLFYYKQFQ